MSKKIIVFIVSTIVLIGGIIGYNYYQKIFGKNVTKDGAIYIGSNYHMMDVKKLLNYDACSILTCHSVSVKMQPKLCCATMMLDRALSCSLHAHMLSKIL